MRSTVIRDKGQMTIPAEIRRAAHLEEGDPIDVEMVADGILLRPRKVIDATQAWFWSPAWQAGEREASLELERGEGEDFSSGAEFVASLDD
jgi:antitoxin PrlF